MDFFSKIIIWGQLVFKNSQFQSYKDFLYKKTGISVSQAKKHMFNTKIQRLMNNNDMSSYDDYYKMISNAANTNKMQEFIDTVTTNTTEFFRENAHFEFLSKNMDSIMQNIPRIQGNKEIRVWSAACSSGQEPLTLAMVLREILGSQIDIKILATDINSKVLAKAMRGIYSSYECDGIPKYYFKKYFVKRGDSYQVKDSIKKCVYYRHYNLMQSFAFRNHFDIIFCRNVMIYFDIEAQQKLITKFYNNLIPSGLLFVGHSESLINKKHQFRYLEPSIFIK